MSADTRNDRDRLDDIRQAIRSVNECAKRGQSIFRGDTSTRAAILYHLQVIGEACRSLSPELKRANPDVPWARIVGLRNIIVHEYFDVDLNRVWSVIENDLPLFERQIEAIMSAGSDS